MAAEESPKNWGTIFMGTDREVNLDQLSAVAPNRGGFWRREQEESYLDRVQLRAKEQAQTILAQAGQSSAALLEEARDEIARMREEAERQAAELLAEQRGLKDDAARLNEDAARLNEDAARLHAQAEQLYASAEERGYAAGYAAGVEQAQADLEHFRAVMGEATGTVLAAVQAQCDRIFARWKEDLCALLVACVEKGTGFVLDADRRSLLERAFLDSVKRFEARSAVLLRVRSDDEALVAEMLAAAKERIPGLDAWHVQGDPELALGDLVLEAAHGRVESRVEERRGIVDEALRHVLLPDSPEEESGRDELAQVAAGAVARMFDLVPKLPRAQDVPREAGTAENAVPAMEDAGRDAETSEAPAEVAVSAVPEAPAVAVPEAADTADVDAVLAGGGFLPAD